MAYTPQATPAPRSVTSFGTTLRILVLALVNGVVLLGIVAVVVGPVGETDPAFTSTFFYGAGALVVVTAALSVFLMRRLRDRLATLGPEANVDATIQTGYIVAMATAEAGALVAMVGALLTGQWAFLGLAAPFVAIAALFFPTQERIESLQALAEQARS